MVMKLMVIDTRGGFYRQIDVKRALESTFAQRKQEITEWALKHTCPDFQCALKLMA